MLRVKSVSRIALVVLGLAVAPRVSAQMAVIAHPSVSVNELERTELERIFSGETTTFYPVVIQRELSERFFRNLLGMGDHAVRRQWVRLLLSGKVPQGPVGLRTDEEVKAFVRTNAHAIGFVTLSSVGTGVRVLHVLPVKG